MEFARILCILALGVLALSTRPAGAGELDYVQVDRFPPPLGTPRPAETLEAPRQGVWATRTVYVADLGDMLVLTYAVAARCGRPLPNVGAAASLVAIQAFPTDPMTARGADLRNRFLEAYVRDHAGRIRRYADLTVADLTQLTDRFLPACATL